MSTQRDKNDSTVQYPPSMSPSERQQDVKDNSFVVEKPEVEIAATDISRLIQANSDCC